MSLDLIDVVQTIQVNKPEIDKPPPLLRISHSEIEEMSDKLMLNPDPEMKSAVVDLFGIPVLICPVFAQGWAVVVGDDIFVSDNVRFNQITQIPCDHGCKDCHEFLRETSAKKDEGGGQ